LPDLEWGEHLLRILLKVGPGTDSGHGPVPVSWGEIDSWSRVSGFFIAGHEAEEIRILSKDYCSSFHAGQDPTEIKPSFGDDRTVTEKRREQVARHFDATFNNLMRANGK